MVCGSRFIGLAEAAEGRGAEAEVEEHVDGARDEEHGVDRGHLCVPGTRMGTDAFGQYSYIYDP